MKWKWLCIPVDCWPASLPWNCGQFHRLQGELAKACSTCPGGDRTRVSALHLLLESLSYSLSIQMPIHLHTLHLDMDDLISILLSPHGNMMTGLLTGAYKIEAARTCICVEEGSDMFTGTDKNSLSSAILKFLCIPVDC